MALGKQIIDIAVHLKKIGKLDNVKSAIDMGDQDINIEYSVLKNKLQHLKVQNFEKIFERAKNYPERPRVSSSALWQSLGIEKTDRLDLIQLERINDVNHSFYKVDLNYPIPNNLINMKYDLVTDIGNNEHPFNVGESYKTLHNLTNKEGLIIIQQGIFRGNGLYNFEIGFFESLAASNNYDILYSSYVIPYNNTYFCVPIDENALELINISKVEEISVIYVYKKNDNESFKYPYQDLGASPKRDEYFVNSLNFENNTPKRNYVPMKVSNLSIKLLISHLLKNIKKRIFK